MADYLCLRKTKFLGADFLPGSRLTFRWKTCRIDDKIAGILEVGRLLCVALPNLVPEIIKRDVFCVPDFATKLQTTTHHLVARFEDHIRPVIQQWQSTKPDEAGGFVREWVEALEIIRGISPFINLDEKLDNRSGIRFFRDFRIYHAPREFIPISWYHVLSAEAYSSILLPQPEENEKISHLRRALAGLNLADNTETFFASKFFLNSPNGRRRTLYCLFCMMEGTLVMREFVSNSLRQTEALEGVRFHDGVLVNHGLLLYDVFRQNRKASGSTESFRDFLKSTIDSDIFFDLGEMPDPKRGSDTPFLVDRGKYKPYYDSIRQWMIGLSSGVFCFIRKSPAEALRRWAVDCQEDVRDLPISERKQGGKFFNAYRITRATKKHSSDGPRSHHQKLWNEARLLRDDT